jgi:hypothetical protein
MTRDVHNIPPALPSISNARSRISSIVGGDSRFTAAAAHILLPVTDVNDEPNATFRVGADGETGDFKGLTLSNSSPVLFGSRGFSLNRGRGEGLPTAAHRCIYAHIMLARPRTLPTGFIAPCPPQPTRCRPAACGCMRLSTMDSESSPARSGHECGSIAVLAMNLTKRFLLIVEALARLRSRSCVIDGEAVACDDSGPASFERIRTASMTGTCSCTPST